MMDRVHRNRAIEGTFLEGQIRQVTDDEQTVVADASPRLTQGLNGNIKADALLVSLRIDLVFIILHRTRARIQHKAPGGDKSIQHAQACLMDVFA